MKLNIIILLYLLFLAFVCMNKPRIVEGSFFSSQDNCSKVDDLLNVMDTNYSSLCTSTSSTPAPTECDTALSMIDFIRNEYNYVCNQEPSDGDNSSNTAILNTEVDPELDPEVVTNSDELMQA